MRLALLAGFVGFTLATACHAFAGVKGSGKIAREARNVGDFEAVAVHAGIDATLSVGEKSVEVSADDNILGLVRIEVIDGVLDIGFERHTTIWGTGTVAVKVRAPRLKAITASGGSHVKGEAVPHKAFRIHASGGSEVRIAPLKVEEIELRASGGSTVALRQVDAAALSARGSGGAVLELAGRAAEAEVSFSGGTVVKGPDFGVERLRVRGSGGGEVEMRVADAVKGSLSGGSTLNVRGNPRSQVRTSGGSEVRYEGRRAERDDHEDDD